MNLTIYFDHRFTLAPSGAVESAKHYDYHFFATRYLPSFDHVTIMGRLASNDESKPPDGVELGEGVTLLTAGDWRGMLGFARNRKRILKRIRWCAAESRAHILIVPGQIGTLASQVLGKYQIPYGVEVIGDPFDTFSAGAFQHPLRPVIQRRASQDLKRIVGRAAAASYVTSGALQTRYPVHPEAFSISASDVVLEPSAVCATPRRHSENDRYHRCVFVGTLERLYKGQDTLVRAFAALASIRPGVSLEVVGEGRYRKHLEHLTAELGIENRVTFSGAVRPGKDVRNILDQAHLFLLPSRQEGLPRAMIEAMARGLPCIGTHVGGIPELLDREDLVEVDDHLALARKIDEVLCDPQRMDRMSARNLARSKLFDAIDLQNRRERMHQYLIEATGTSRGVLS